MTDEPLLIEMFSDAPTYRALRVAGGMSPKTEEAAERGLRNTLYGVSLPPPRRDRRHGAHRRRRRLLFRRRRYRGRAGMAGCGPRVIMAALDAWLRANAPESAYVHLAADGDAKFLYEKFGFVETAPATVNMAYTVKPRAAD